MEDSRAGPTEHGSKEPGHSLIHEPIPIEAGAAGRQEASRDASRGQDSSFHE